MCIVVSQLQNKLGEFLSIVDVTFSEFVNIYKTSLPPTSSVEYKFIIGLLGIVTNLSASPKGREFLITNFSGGEFVLKIIKLIPELPSSPGSLSLKRYMQFNKLSRCNLSVIPIRSYFSKKFSFP